VYETASPHCQPPKAQKQGIVAGQTGRLEVVKTALGDVRFGSKADIASGPLDVRFTPRKRTLVELVLDVCFVPQADIGKAACAC
jgi:hypothetical protein